MLLQSIAIEQESYIEDTTDFINFIENTQIPDHAVLATLDVSSLYTNIPQDEGIVFLCRYYEDHYERNYLSRQAIYGNWCGSYLKKTLKFNEKHFVQTHSIAMGN